MQAFREENGYTAEHYNNHYRGASVWESELTSWLSAKGFPCRAWSTRNDTSGTGTMSQILNTGLEMEESLSSMFWIKWS